MKDERKEACLGRASHEHRQSGGRSRPSFSPLLAVRLPAFLWVHLCPSPVQPWLPWLPPFLAAPSWGRGFVESCFAVLFCCVNVINNEKQAGVYYFA